MNRKKALMFLLVMSIVTALVHADESSLDGIWRSVGYGQIMRVEAGQVAGYDISKAGCFHSFDEKLNELGEVVDVSDTSLIIGYGINLYHYTRLRELPSACTGKPENPSDPLLNFDSVWHTFNEHYAFFEGRNVDWDASYQRYRSKLRQDSSDVELYVVLNAMLSEIDDAHVSLDVPDSVRKQAAEDSPGESRPSMFALQQAARQALVEKYLDEAQIYNNGIVRWGWVSNSGEKRIAYIQLNAMLLLAQYPVETSGDFRSFFRDYFAYAEEREYQYLDEVAGANSILDEITARIGDADAVVLDVRFNGGGKDGAGLAVMNHFVSEGQTVFTKKARHGNGFTAKQEIRLEPAAMRYDGPVYLLTGPATASAAEIMVLSSLPLPNVTRVGASTEGIFSDTLDKKMPNGWEYTLSNELYEDLAGRNYEGSGIPPQHGVDYPRDARSFHEYIIANLDDGDEAVEWVLKQHLR